MKLLSYLALVLVLFALSSCASRTVREPEPARFKSGYQLEDHMIRLR